VVELDDVTTSNTESISPTWFEEKTSTAPQGEVGNSFGTPNGIPNPNHEMPAKPDETTGQRQGHEREEVLIKDITKRPYSEREEDNAKIA
jgi:hypothetical protein